MGRNDYTAAGLSFMRIAVFYPETPWNAKALFRVAEIHERLERLDIACDLYRRVSLFHLTGKLITIHFWHYDITYHQVNGFTLQ